MFDTTTNTFKPSYNQSNSLNINAVSGMLVKNHPKSFIAQCQFGSEIAKNLFNKTNPQWGIYKGYHYEKDEYDYRKSNRIDDYEYHDVVVLQVLLCGDNRVMCEVVYKEDWEAVDVE